MKKSVSLLAAICIAWLSFSKVAFAGPEGSYSNPVLPGDFPDPSVVRVGEDYWAVATSSEWAPLFPILHSRDLVNWKLKGTIFQKKPAWSSRNYWAPEISFYKGKFYLYYVGRKDVKDGSLAIAVATATKAEGPWEDHGPFISQPEGSIDAVTAIDENDERYLLWKNDGNSRKQPTMIWAQKLSDDGTKVVGEPRELIRNDAPWEGALVEGPFVQRHGEWFYLFYSGAGCCGKKCDYGLGVARAKNLLGAYEKCPGNPILAKNDHWQCPGHGSIVTTPDGRTFLLYHAYEARGWVYVGRQGLLDEVKWSKDGWPTINEARGPSFVAATPFPKTVQQPKREFFDDFTGQKLSVLWQWPHSSEPVTALEHGELALQSPDRQKDLLGAALATQTTAADYVATTRILLDSVKPGVFAGLSAFGDRANALGIAAGDDKVVLWRRHAGKHEPVTTRELADVKEIYLRMTVKDGFHFYFALSRDGKKWEDMGSSDGLTGDYLPPWDRGVRIALTVGGVEGAKARFDWLRVTDAEIRAARN